MKRFLILFFAMVLSLGLVACDDEGTTSNANENDNSNNNEENNNSDNDDVDNNSEGNSNNDDETTEKDSDDTGNIIEDDVGILTIEKQNKDIEEVANSGPMELTISGIQLAELEPSDDYIDVFFDGKELVTVVTVEMKAENTSEDDISMYPDQATLTTDAGDQVDADMLLSDDVGGDFFGSTNKKGDIVFLVDTPPSDINEIKLIIDGAHDDDFDRVGDDLKIELSF